MQLIMFYFSSFVLLFLYVLTLVCAFEEKMDKA